MTPGSHFEPSVEVEMNTRKICQTILLTLVSSALSLACAPALDGQDDANERSEAVHEAVLDHFECSMEPANDCAEEVEAVEDAFASCAGACLDEGFRAGTSITVDCQNGPAVTCEGYQCTGTDNIGCDCFTDPGPLEAPFDQKFCRKSKSKETL